MLATCGGETCKKEVAQRPLDASEGPVAMAVEQWSEGEVGEGAIVDNEDGEVGAQSEERRMKMRKVKMRGTRHA